MKHHSFCLVFFGGWLYFIGTWWYIFGVLSQPRGLFLFLFGYLLYLGMKYCPSIEVSNSQYRESWWPLIFLWFFTDGGIYLGYFPLKMDGQNMFAFLLGDLFTDSTIVNHQFAPPPLGRIIVESLFPSVANLRISFIHIFIGFSGF